MTLSGEWVERVSSRGHKYRVWRRQQRVPRIPQHYLDCSIYLYRSRLAALSGEESGGSGCLVSVVSNPVFDPSSYKGGIPTRILHAFPPHVYAVTNKHVVRQGFSIIRLNTVDNEHDVLEIDPYEWIPHPDGDDLAIAPLDLAANRHNYYPISTDQFLSRDRLGSDVGAGDDVFMVGRFVTHAGVQRNTPTLRFGSIAMLPFEKVKLGKEANHHMQEAFLVETRSLSGYSGSPVFVYRPVEAKASNDLMGSTGFSYADILDSIGTTKPIGELVGHLSLLGINCGHVQQYDRVVDGRLLPHQQWRVSRNTGMAIVIPAWRLENFLKGNDLLMQRIQKDKQYISEKEAKQKEAEEGTAMDVETSEVFTDENYFDALKRASRKVSEPDPEKTETSE